MMEWGARGRCRELQERIKGEGIKGHARIDGRGGSWTRTRDMPLKDILLCTLGKKALITTMEVRQYFQAAEKVDQTVSKQDYLQQRQNLNWEVFRVLNRERWEIEMKYHTLKNKMKFESVTGKASIYVEQDFLAQVVIFNMTEDLTREAEEKARERGKERSYKYEVRINENIAIGLWKEQFVRLMLEDDNEKREQMFIRLKEDMVRNIVPVRQLKGRARKERLKFMMLCPAPFQCELTLSFANYSDSLALIRIIRGVFNGQTEQDKRIENN
jgi:hypothetical protein